MEDALAHSLLKNGAKVQKSLNPCCNGRCTRTNYENIIKNI